MSLLFFYRLSFGFRSENSFGKEKDRSFWKLTKPQPYTLCYFNVSTIALTWTSVKKDGLLNKKDLNLNPVSPFTVLMRPYRDWETFVTGNIRDWETLRDWETFVTGEHSWLGNIRDWETS